MKCLPLTAALPLLFAAFILQVHAQGTNNPLAGKPAAQAAPAARPFVNAEVTEVDQARGLVTLNHDPIPNLNMPAMTMPFDVADKKLLLGLKAGDRIRAQFDTVNGKMLLTGLEHSR